MSKIILIRHGESLGNVEERYYTLPDVANILSMKGVDQAVQLSFQIDKIMNPDYYQLHTTVISSSHQRAKLTAQIAMSRTRYPIIHDNRLNEVRHISECARESNESCQNRMKSLLASYEFNLVCFTHCHFMQSLDPSKPTPKNAEVRVYDRTEFIKLLNNQQKKIIL
jgi:bisphosphoglycerate-dependent phosphoglycerate mutase